jgi:hypothetical protein
MDDTGPPTLTCGLGTCGVVQVSADEMPALRKDPAPPGLDAPPPSVLKYADDQAVVALAAMLRAVRLVGLPLAACTDWGVVAAPRFLGRTAAIDAYHRFVQRGPLSVSPLIVPYLTLHSVASLLSLTLGSHGPNFGVGGDAEGLGEALLAGVTVLTGDRPPGMWVVATEWDPEPGTGGGTPVCHAVALGLVPATEGLARLRLRPAMLGLAGAEPALPTVADLAHCLTDPARPPRWHCFLPGGWHLELTGAAWAAEPLARAA